VAPISRAGSGRRDRPGKAVNVPGSPLSISRLTRNIGAEIGGIDLRLPLDALTIAEVWSAVVAHKVVFFRNQRMDHDQQIAFARQFGELTHAHPREDGRSAQPGPAPVFAVDSAEDACRYGETYQYDYAKPALPLGDRLAH
jgi:taurine dioxygenase